MSLLDRLEVPEAKSRASSRPTERPRVAASRAQPAPTTPPPTTSTSTWVPGSAESAATRPAGESADSVNVDPIERALHGLLPLAVPRRPLLVGPFRLPAPGLVPVVAQFVGGLPEADREPGR